MILTVSILPLISNFSWLFPGFWGLFLGHKQLLSLSLSCYNFTLASFFSFYTSFSWWAFTGVWVTTSFPKSPGLFSDSFVILVCSISFILFDPVLVPFESYFHQNLFIYFFLLYCRTYLQRSFWGSFLSVRILCVSPSLVISLCCHNFSICPSLIFHQGFFYSL